MQPSDVRYTHEGGYSNTKVGMAEVVHALIFGPSEVLVKHSCTQQSYRNLFGDRTPQQRFNFAVSETRYSPVFHVIVQ